MVTVVRRRSQPARPVPSSLSGIAPVGRGVSLERRMQLEYLGLDDITPYEYNPRDNLKAIPAVASSIRAFGFLVPCVVDANNILVAGHTRLAAARLIGMTEVPCLRAEHLSAEQVIAFRLIDNKVSELAVWDHDILSAEIGKLADTGIDFTQFGWRQEEIDCLSEIVSDECLRQSVDTDAETTARTAERRAPATARVVIGEFVFFLPVAAYRGWADGIRELCEFNEDAITVELKRRLGLPIV